jgi:hypothetical protein
MKITARYKLLQSTRANGKGLMVWGDVLEGHVKAGDFITFSTGREEITLQIASVETSSDSISADASVVLLFTYKGEKQKKAVESLQLPVQVVEIIGK